MADVLVIHSPRFHQNKSNSYCCLILSFKCLFMFFWQRRNAKTRVLEWFKTCILPIAYLCRFVWCILPEFSWFIIARQLSVYKSFHFPHKLCLQHIYMRDTFVCWGQNHHILFFNQQVTVSNVHCHWQSRPIYMLFEACDQMSISLTDIAHMTAQTCDLVYHITSHSSGSFYRGNTVFSLRRVIMTLHGA